MKAIPRKSVILFQALVVAVLVSGCISNRPKLVNADAVPVYGIAPLYHTVYAGSDAQYHYFGWNRGLRSGQVKVDKTSLKLSREFPVGADTMFVTRTDDGKLILMLPIE